MTKKIIISIFFSLIVLVGAVVAVLVAYKQNTQSPVAPTVPQIKPEASSPTTTPACGLTFTVVAPRGTFCDSLTANPTSGTAPLTVNFALSGHTTGAGSIVNYKFDFGDGTVPVGQSTGNISHIFVSEGSFVVKGTVADDLGNTAGGSDNCQFTVVTGHVVYKYKKCENLTCKEEDCVPNTTPCSGLTTCQSDSDCQPKYQHKVCLGSSCSLVDCSPPTVACRDSCSSDAQCVPVVYRPPTPVATPSPTPTHRECRNRACVVVKGAMADSCTSDVSCQPAATPPPIPRSGNIGATIGTVVLGVGALLVGILILL